MSFFRRVQCKFFGHPGVFREWEWKPASPQWKERDDAWTCIRCRSDLLKVPHRAISYIVARPFLDAAVIEHINKAVDTYGESFVRIRSGDPSTRHSRKHV